MCSINIQKLTSFSVANCLKIAVPVKRAVVALTLQFWFISYLSFTGTHLIYSTCQAEVINYSGDLNTPPDEAAKIKKTNFIGKKKVKGRGTRDDESSDENDW